MFFLKYEGGGQEKTTLKKSRFIRVKIAARKFHSFCERSAVPSGFGNIY